MDHEIIVFGGDDEKNRFFVIENEKIVAEGLLPAEGRFDGFQCGKDNFGFVIANSKGKFFKF